MPSMLPMIEKRFGTNGGRTGGYVLIYVTVILFFMTTVVFSIAASLHDDARLAIRFKDRTRVDYLFEAALQYGLAQVLKANAVTAAIQSLSEREIADLDPWQKDHLYEIVIDDVQIDFRFSDGGGLVDVNYVTPEEFLRYFTALPLSADEVQGTPEEWVDALIIARQAAGKNNNSAGFATVSDVTNLEALPYVIRFGRPDVVEVDQKGVEHIVEEGVPSLSEVFTVGTQTRQVSVTQAPLPLFVALFEATDEQLKKIIDLRNQEKPPTVKDFAEVLGDSASSSLIEDGVSAFVRIKMSMTTPRGGTKSQHVLVKLSGTAYKIIDRGV